jgi:hypothetical protein
MGESELVARCVALLEVAWDVEAPSAPPDPPPCVDTELLDVLGGAGATEVLSGRWDGPFGYWSRTWALRAFLYVWAPSALDVVIRALDDHHWRVREMAAKVLSHQPAPDPRALAALEARLEDGTPRVRAAVRRALRQADQAR